MYHDIDEFEYDGFYSDSDDSGCETSQGVNRNSPPPDPRKQLEKQIQDAATNGRIIDLHQALFDNTINVDIESPLDGGWTALMYAAFASQSEIVAYLIENNANVDKDGNGLTPLMCACLSTNMNEISNLSCVKRLLEAGATVNLFDKSRQTALMKAIEHGKVHAAKLIIPKANLEMTDSYNRTAVFYAVLNKQDEILKCLIEHKASLDKLDKFKNSIKDLAIMKNHKPTIDLLQSYLEEKEPQDVFIMETMNDWTEMFPGILNNKKPAYWYEIPSLLFGMHCERLVKTLKEANVDLYKFLSLTEDDMKDVNINLSYLRKRLKLGLYKFHTRKWNMKTVLGYSSNVKKNMDFKFCLDHFSSHMKHMVVMRSAHTYMIKSVKLNKATLPLELEPKIDHMIKQIHKTKLELEQLGIFIKNINELSPIPADYIGPQKKSYQYISKKCLFYVTTLSAVLIISATKIVQSQSISIMLKTLPMPRFLLR